jgi:hypothetical protein
MSSSEPLASPLLLPNLGAEEGSDWRALRDQPHARAAAGSWALLFGRDARLVVPDANGEWRQHPRDALWPEDLGPAPDDPAFPWLADTGAEATRAIAWLPTATLETELSERQGRKLAGASVDATWRVHDKAFAARTAAELGLTPRALAPLVEVLEPEALRAPDALLARLDGRLAEWPEWTQRRFTLKPRFGSSGRGRVGGRSRVEGAALRGALARLAERGGAIFEPWLDRVKDLSVCLRIPEAAGAAEVDALPTLLGSLETWSTPSGVYRGHCGEVDSRGRVFSGDPRDESLRADAAAVASRAREQGFFGVCGIDSFAYREPTGPDGEPILRLRGAVELNARPTMGLVAIGLVRRALPRVREALELSPGARRGFAFTYHDRSDRRWRERLQDGLGPDAILLDLSTGREAETPRAVLAFARDPARLRSARRDVFGC